MYSQARIEEITERGACLINREQWSGLKRRREGESATSAVSPKEVKSGPRREGGKDERGRRRTKPPAGHCLFR